jgi:methyltransferase (TIGR00027 family)
MQPVSLTAQWTAAIRALESERKEGALFYDGLAQSLAQPDGFALLQRYRGAGVQEFVAIRTRYFDDACAAALAEQPNIRQVVVVAAGMDTRSFRLDWPRGTKIYELDHGALLIEKAKRLEVERATPRAIRIAVAVDLALNWPLPLIDAGFDAHSPALWLIEGLLLLLFFFLTEPQVRRLLAAVRAFSAPFSRVVTDMTSMSLLRSPFSQLFLSTLRRDGVPWQFGTDHPESFIGEQGWEVYDLKEPGEPGAGGKRWPYTVQPRHLPGVARSWLITAVRAP